MKRNGFRLLINSLLIVSLLAIASVAASAQQPSFPPAPGRTPIGTPMWPTTPLPYSWEVGKHRTQKFGELSRNKPSKEVRKLLKMKEKEEKANAKNR